MTFYTLSKVNVLCGPNDHRIGVSRVWSYDKIDNDTVPREAEEQELTDIVPGESLRQNVVLIHVPGSNLVRRDRQVTLLITHLLLFKLPCSGCGSG